MVRDLYQDVTNRIVTELEQGVKPWTKPWKSTAHAAPMLPANLVTGRHYNGVNTLVLWLEAYDKGYPSHGWLTFQQAVQAGGNVRKGEKGIQVVFAKTVERETDGKLERFPAFKWYTVFNKAQVEGVGTDSPPPAPLKGKVNDIAKGSGVELSYGHRQACYIPSRDRIKMPYHTDFVSQDAFTRVLFHELSHATGHEKRLNRNLSTRFGDASYAMEELVAELSSAFLCARIGAEYANENAEYIATWVRKMKQDSKAIFTASSQAAKSADWLHDHSLHHEKQEELEHSL
jgi:antirestriction protein ArdC